MDPYYQLRLPPLSPLRFPDATETPALSDLTQGARTAVLGARAFLFSSQREQGHWCAELESNTTITSEYIFLCSILGLSNDLVNRQSRITAYLLGQQNHDGSWSIAHRWEGDVSTTAETYLALRILGLPQDDPCLLRSENYIRRNGGLEKIRIFTRIIFAMFGLLPWNSIPAIPPEMMLIPPKSPLNIYALSSWARGTMIPLFIIAHHQPVYALPNGRSHQNTWLDHLWLNSEDKNIPYSSPWIQMVFRHGLSVRTFFGAADVCLKFYERIRLRGIRRRALERCTRWILERQEESGDWAGIFPPMLNGVIALTLQGYSVESGPVSKALQAIERFSWEDENGLRIQACVSPVWDTVLASIGLMDCGTPPAHPRLKKARRWVLERQLRVAHGDWKVSRPDLLGGGWSFEYFNSWYPDIDDTAAVLLALLKQDLSSAQSKPIQTAIDWTLGMQNRDGGWAAFDVDNDKDFLNEIPFSDMDSLCDPSTPDVTGRVIEALGLFMEHSLPQDDKIHKACTQAVEYLRRTQEVQGSWFGRWGVNYIYGTCNVLCGLSRLKKSANFPTLDPTLDPMIEHALAWLRQIQNRDGGWGESLASYADKRWMGRGESTASQTAWALMGLLAFCEPEDPAIQRGVRWLIARQKPAPKIQAFEGSQPLPVARGSTWEEESYTGTGFPNHFYLRYHLYRHYFPMMALGRFLQALEN